MDVFLSIIGIILCSPLAVILLLLGYFDTGRPIFLQTRVGKQKKEFSLVKFRSMKLDTPDVATHLANTQSVTKLGRILRKSKLDELPQLWNVLKGDMSLVGPRPCLPNQTDLIAERTRLGLFDYRPGITGLAQINGVDMSDPYRLTQMELVMVKDITLRSYFTYIFKTILGAGFGDKIVR